MNKILMALTTAFALAACAPGAAENAQTAAQSVPQEAAVWSAANSQIRFLSSKINQAKGSTTEQSEFAVSAARLEQDGRFNMTVDLSSVKTHIDIRDQRLKDWVFEVVQFPEAKISGQLDAQAVNKLALGESLKLKQPLVLEIRGQKLDIEADLLVQRHAADSIGVATLSPVLLDVKQMDMVQGVARLVEVMGLSSIVEQIPVSFSGEFKREGA